jgi:hypothetical protein
MASVHQVQVQNSYQLFHICHAFQPSSISLLRLGNKFLISSLFLVTKLQIIVSRSHRLTAFHSQFQWTHISISLQPLWQWRLKLYLNGIKRVIIHLSVSKNYGFHTIVSDYFYRSPIPIPTSMGAWCAHKRQQGQTFHITESKIHINYSENHDSALMLVLCYFYMSPPLSNPHPYHC